MEKISAQEIEIRPAVPADLNFIYATWLKSYRHASQFAKKISNDIFFDMHQKVIERFLSRLGATVLIAYPKGEPEVILGYIAYDTDQNVVQYIYVKRTFRKMGIGAALAKEATPRIFTHWTYDVDWIHKKYPELIYNPYFL